jgi:hypothetical protein
VQISALTSQDQLLTSFGDKQDALLDLLDMKSKVLHCILLGYYRRINPRQAARWNPICGNQSTGSRSGSDDQQWRAMSWSLLPPGN